MPSRPRKVTREGGWRVCDGPPRSRERAVSTRDSKSSQAVTTAAASPLASACSMRRTASRSAAGQSSANESATLRAKGTGAEEGGGFACMAGAAVRAEAACDEAERAAGTEIVGDWANRRRALDVDFAGW